MDAWASASHYLDYKTEEDVPAELKRDFYALSGLFYVADQHFEFFFKSREQVKEKVSEEFQRHEPDLDQQINLDNLAAYLGRRFPDRHQPSPADLSELLQELTAADYATLKRLDDSLNAGKKAFSAYEKERPPSSPSKTFAQVGVVRVTLDICDDKFAQPRASHWAKDLPRYRELLEKPNKKSTGATKSE